MPIYAELRAEWLRDEDEEEYPLTKREYLAILDSLASKVSKTDAPGTLYGTDRDGEQASIPYDADATHEELPVRRFVVTDVVVDEGE